ncbi:GumC family protein [Neiella holothuriorum]|nr:hypothetical protein [Neiella holothuriorum]
MAFGPEIDVTAASSNLQQQQHEENDARMRKRVLAISFATILLLGLAFVWLRSPVYQSSALVQLTFPDVGTLAPEAMAERAFAVSERKLTSESVQTNLLNRLNDGGFELSGEQLNAMLSSHGEPADRMLTLFVQSEHQDLPLPVINEWLGLYLAEYQQQQGERTDKNQQHTNDKLADLEARISKQRESIRQFSAQYDVSSIQQEENRAINKMKNVTSALNEAEKQQIQAAAQLDAIKEAKRLGSPIASPDAKAQAQRLRASILSIEQELAELSERYTDKYMALDPDIVKKTRKRDSQQQELDQLTTQSAALYETETKQALLDAQGRVTALTAQRQALRDETIASKERLSDYRNLVAELDILENQARAHKAKLLDIEVVQSDVPRIDVLEYPAAPTYPIGPNYWLDSLWVLLAATLGALLSFKVLAMVSVRRPTGPTSANYTVVQTGNAAPGLGQSTNQQLEHQQNQLLENQHVTTPAIAQAAPQPSQLPNVTSTPRQLSTVELSNLFSQAPTDIQLAIGLMLSGVAPSEFSALKGSQFDSAQQMLHLSGRFQRSLTLPASVIALLPESLSLEASLWLQEDGSQLTVEDIDAILLIAAEDAALSNPAEVTVAVIRHSYLCFIAEQGLKLSEMESVSGYISPKQLSWYRGLNHTAVPEVQLTHPALGA